MFYYWMVCNIHEHERSCIFVISVPILPLSTSLLLNFGTVPTVWYFLFFIFVLLWIRVITKLPNTEQSSKGKSKTHKSTNRQNQSTTGKLGKPQWPWLATGTSKEMVGWIRFSGAKPPAFITVKRFRVVTASDYSFGIFKRFFQQYPDIYWRSVYWWMK